MYFVKQGAAVGFEVYVQKKAGIKSLNLGQGILVKLVLFTK